MRRPKGKEEKRNQSQKLWKCKNIPKRHTNGISKCESECLMNWKKLRIQFTFEIIFCHTMLPPSVYFMAQMRSTTSNWWLGLSFYPFCSRSASTKVKLLSGFFSLEYIYAIKIDIDRPSASFPQWKCVRPNQAIYIKWQIFRPIFDPSQNIFRTQDFRYKNTFLFSNGKNTKSISSKCHSLALTFE